MGGAPSMWRRTSRPTAFITCRSGAGSWWGAISDAGSTTVVGGWQTAVDLGFHSGFGDHSFAGAYMGDEKPAGCRLRTLTGSYEPRPDCVAGVAQSVGMQTVQIGSSIGKTNLNPAAVTEVADGQLRQLPERRVCEDPR